MIQNTSNLFLIKPCNFFCNPETSVNNYFQNSDSDSDIDSISNKALLEFDFFLNKLKKNNLNIYQFKDTKKPITPDSIFPNNWISTYQNNTIIIHSMFAKNRRLEKRVDIIDFLKKKFTVDKVYNSSEDQEKKNKFLEGTGSMVLDRVNKVVYAVLSERTSHDLLLEFCDFQGFKLIPFNAYQDFDKKKMIYHTNVMMSLCENFVIICLDSVIKMDEKKILLDSFNRNKKEIIFITMEQVNKFCGNVLEVKNTLGENILIMSSKAFNSFSKKQIKIINKFCKIVHSPLDTIEKYGGGGARCMIAEIFLKKK
jgi:hypothetical protein